jgi:hypothetical protein
MYHEPDHYHHTEDEEADIYMDSLRGKRVIRWAVGAVILFLTILLTYILL